MRLLLHTALLATAAIAAPAPLPDCGRGGYNSWGGDASTCAEVDTKGAHNERDRGVSIKSSLVDTNADTNADRKGYNEVQETSKRSANTDRGRGAYNGWDEDSEDSSSAETNGGRGAYNGWDGDSKESPYADFGRQWHRGRDSQRGSCDLRNAVMPAAPIALPPPAAGLTLGHVAIGRGNQNYTCDLSNSTAVPVAAGAVATLFNVSCLAADMPELLSRLCPIALDLPIPSSSDAASPIYQGMSGHHYFKDASTPYFDLDTGAHRYGTGAFKKGDSTPAPATAMAGPYNSGNGPVAWLRLDAKTTTEGQVFKEVYRLNTAGGQPPKTCEGMPAAFEVPYAAEYWLFQ